MAPFDLGVVRDAVSLLPRLLQELRAIHQAVEELNAEVRLMREGVERIHAETRVVGEAVSPLDERLNEVGVAVARLEPKIAEVSDAIHPLRRATGLLTRRNSRDANGRAAQAEAQPAAADDEG